MTSTEQGRIRDAIILALAAACDSFTVADIPGMSRKVASNGCLHLERSGALVRIKPHRGPILARFGLLRRLMRNHELAKLEAECLATRRTLALWK